MLERLCVGVRVGVRVAVAVDVGDDVNEDVDVWDSVCGVTVAVGVAVALLVGVAVAGGLPPFVYEAAAVRDKEMVLLNDLLTEMVRVLDRVDGPVNVELELGLPLLLALWLVLDVAVADVHGTPPGGTPCSHV